MRLLGLLVALVVVSACGGAATTTQQPAINQAPATADPGSGGGTTEEVTTPEPEISLPKSHAKVTERNWKKIVKAPDDYTGKGYQLWACITQFDAATGDDSFLGNASFKKLKYWYQGENAYFTGEPRALIDVVEDDVVVMNVVGLGSYSYDTQIGGNTTVPAFLVTKITRKGSC